MRMSLPGGVRLDFKPLYEEAALPWSARAYRQNEQLGEILLKGDSHPEVRYLLVLYFYDESIAVNGKAPHAITLKEYRELYKAMFDRECVYTDKKTSLDYLRSHAPECSFLKPLGLRFKRGGLCEFNLGTPDTKARNEFRSQLIKELSEVQCQSEQEKAELTRRLNVLRSYLAASPAAYVGAERLLKQTLTIGDNELTLYGSDAPDFTALIKRCRLILLGGRCGSGKTTLLKYMALSKGLMGNFNIYERRLAAEKRLFSAAELENIKRSPQKGQLFLLDGFNELPRGGKDRTRVLSDIRALKEYPNVYIVLSTTGAPGAFRDFTNAYLGNVLPDPGDEPAGSELTETPLIYNAYMRLPAITRERMKSEYSVLEYSSRVKIEAIIERADIEGAENARVAYYIMLPLLSERMCLEQRITFDESEKRVLFEKVKTGATGAFTREVYSRLGESLPALSSWSSERLENAFNLLRENGDIETRGGLYAFKHQSARDFNAACYQVEKLRLLLDGVPGMSEGVCMNLDQYARELLRQALGMNINSGMFEEDSIGRETLDYNLGTPEYAPLNMNRVLLFNAAAQMYEYLVPKTLPIWFIDITYKNALNKAMRHLCDNTSELKRAIENDPSNALYDLVSFPFCKMAELAINQITKKDSPDESVKNCLYIALSGSEIFGDCPRLMHSKAKALLYSAWYQYKNGRDDEAADSAKEGAELLKKCMSLGSFLSANLVAFMASRPVPMVYKLLPEEIDPARGFIININTATRDDLLGLMRAYAGNQALDQLLMGEVKINLFSGMRGFIQVTNNDETARAAVSIGDGRPGRKALKLARALLNYKGETMSDDCVMTLFYKLAIDWYELSDELSTGEVNRRLRDIYNAELLQKYSHIISTVPFDPFNLYFFQEGIFGLMALYFINQSLSDDIDYGERLKPYLSAIKDAMKTLTAAERDSMSMDNEHSYYISKRLIYFIELFASRGEQAPPFIKEAEELRAATEAFGRKHLGQA